MAAPVPPRVIELVPLWDGTIALGVRIEGGKVFGYRNINGRRVRFSTTTERWGRLVKQPDTQPIASE